jgi:hypothetical protein
LERSGKETSCFGGSSSAKIGGPFGDETAPIKKNMVAALSQSLNRLDSSSIKENKELSADAVIWLGDFNYRINGVVGAVMFSMKRNLYDVLLDNDQFLIEKKIGRLAQGLNEGKICFAPTYKL